MQTNDIKPGRWFLAHPGHGYFGFHILVIEVKTPPLLYRESRRAENFCDVLFVVFGSPCSPSFEKTDLEWFNHCFYPMQKKEIRD